MTSNGICGLLGFTKVTMLIGFDMNKSKLGPIGATHRCMLNDKLHEGTVLILTPPGVRRHGGIIILLLDVFVVPFVKSKK